MMSSARARTPTNRALELIQTSKLWLLELLESTNNPPPPLWTQLPLVSRIPYLGSALSGQPDQRPNHKTSLEFYLAHLKKNLKLREPARELEYFNKLKEKLTIRVQIKEQKLAFLVAYYERLNQLASEFAQYNPYSIDFMGQNEPRVRIIKALKDHYESNSAIASELDLRPALLDKKLEEQEASFNKAPYISESLPRSSTQAIQFSIKPDLEQRSSLPLPTTIDDKESSRVSSRIEKARDKHSLPILPAPSFVAQTYSPPPINLNERLNRRAGSGRGSPSLPPLIVNNQPVKNDLSNLVDETETLKKYKKACEKYSIHLLSAILDEIETCYDKNKEHSLFSVLSPRRGNSPRQIAQVLLDSYYPANNGRAIDTYLAIGRANDRKQMDIDLAIHATRPQFHDAWEKYKLVKKLEQSQSVYAFHRLLNEGKNKEILTKRRDGYLMTFVKLCGLAVATILGLPLGIVGGAYLGYRSLFGSRATEGHLFLRKIDKLTEEGKKQPGSRRCFIC